MEQTEQLQFNVDGREAILLRVDTHPVPMSRLTDSERTVAAHLLEGRSYREISATRSTSVHTVANQARSVYRKLGIQSRWQLSGRLAGHEELPETGG
jgi:DNA-binding CsgD family transcriptional regulator